MFVLSLVGLDRLVHFMEDNLDQFAGVSGIYVLQLNAVLEVLLDIAHQLHVHVQVRIDQLLQHHLGLLVLRPIFVHKPHAQLLQNLLVLDQAEKRRTTRNKLGSLAFLLAVPRVLLVVEVKGLPCAFESDFLEFVGFFHRGVTFFGEIEAIAPFFGNDGFVGFDFFFVDMTLGLDFCHMFARVMLFGFLGDFVLGLGFVE